MSQSQPKHHLYPPPEIIDGINSYFVPRQGLCISNDPDIHADFATISALARTSRSVRSQVLHNAYNRPLRIVITSGRDCRCRCEDHRSGNIVHPLLGKALALSVLRFRKIQVSFAPDLHAKPCEYVYQRIWRQQEPPLDKHSTEMAANMYCIEGQSKALTRGFQKILSPFTSRHTPSFTFEWDGSRGVAEANRQRDLPLWNFRDLHAAMTRWRWVKHDCFVDHQISLPEQVATGCLDASTWEALRSSDSWRYCEDSLKACPPVPRSPSELLGQSWQFCPDDFWSDASWFMQNRRYHRRLGFCMRFVVTMEQYDGPEGGWMYHAKGISWA
ncbi:hypothetical protein G647_04251 [Cladophialophora carrionii CBS 160.54]|uniref:Uncharacterized protein n=1 Tax=Cladophialophora carrionii CBS 160.54 TaxID=1279043 RepID=V9DDZ7_9EURO|nr:uncharacterized protein G647_04251 [Cladophialophora carrionii CBS 160.54]ETI24881.1 hypothetical protein G647_04251 [Cladophialophora carrionii CBS 160.54]